MSRKRLSTQKTEGEGERERERERERGCDRQRGPEAERLTMEVGLGPEGVSDWIWCSVNSFTVFLTLFALAGISDQGPARLSLELLVPLPLSCGASCKTRCPC